ncbi:MAG TPA: outer membrane beta-barrel protein [Vicinamibacterales bacterium]|nr:outer membrane beta-barrel protein [Vicinamibacterales bacterium]
MMRASALASLFLCVFATSAVAQTKGRVSVGGSITYVHPTDGEVKSLVGGGPLVRLNPKKGWGPAGALNWFRADLDDPATGDGPFATLRVRPLMGGIAYTIGNQPTLVSFSVVVGPSFNKLEFEDDFLDTLPAGPRADLDASTSFAVRPGVDVTVTVAPRVAIIGFGGYMINRPDVTYRDVDGQEYRKRWKADSVVLSIGGVYSLF